MKSLSGNSMSTSIVDAGHVSLQVWEYAGASSMRPSSSSTDIHPIVPSLVLRARCIV